jgi:hypothetical protein
MVARIAAEYAWLSQNSATTRIYIAHKEQLVKAALGR